MSRSARIPSPLRSAWLAAALALLALPGCDSAGGGGDVAGPEYTVRIVVAGSGAGVVTSQPPAITCPGTCGPLDWSPGGVVMLIATPTAPSTFAGWTGSVTSTNDTVQVVVTGHMVVTATFNP
jgi:hypothetical protein